MVATLGCGGPARAATLKGLIEKSPFVPEDFHLPTTVIKEEPLPSAPLTLELHGYSKVGNAMQYSFYDTRTKSSYWVSPGDKNPDIQIVSDYNPSTGAMEILARGRPAEVKMKEASTLAMAELPSTPPLVVYSPFDTGAKRSRSSAQPTVNAPAPVTTGPATAPNNNPRNNAGQTQRGSGQGRGNVAGGQGTGRIGLGSGTVAGGLNPGSSSAGTGAVVRRPIAQPSG
jgi:hypothetical protein